MNTFYTPNITSIRYILNKEESQHAIRVLRLKIGNTIQLIDGKGGFYITKIIDDHPKKCEVKIIEKKEDYGKRDFYLHLAVAPTKNISRYEWFLEKITEIGVEEITPIMCEHSERKTIKNERLNKVIISAMKQATNAYNPKLNGVIKFRNFIDKDFYGEKYIAYCGSSQSPSPTGANSNIPKKEYLKDLYRKGRNVLILIGPEGDFSEGEINHAVRKGFIPISLGNSRMRTETAAVVACSAINLLNQ